MKTVAHQMMSLIGEAVVREIAGHQRRAGVAVTVQGILLVQPLVLRSSSGIHKKIAHRRQVEAELLTDGDLHIFGRSLCVSVGWERERGRKTVFKDEKFGHPKKKNDLKLESSKNASKKGLL